MHMSDECVQQRSDVTYRHRPYAPVPFPVARPPSPTCAVGPSTWVPLPPPPSAALVDVWREDEDEAPTTSPRVTFMTDLVVSRFFAVTMRWRDRAARWVCRPNREGSPPPCLPPAFDENANADFRGCVSSWSHRLISWHAVVTRVSAAPASDGSQLPSLVAKRQEDSIPRKTARDVRPLLHLLRARIIERHQAEKGDGEGDDPFAGGSFMDGFDGDSATLPRRYFREDAFSNVGTDPSEYLARHFPGATVEWLQGLSPLDQLLIRFLVYRRLDVPTAADRFLALRRFMLRHQLTFADMSIRDPAIRDAIQQCGIHHYPDVVDDTGRVVVVNSWANWNWDAMSVAAACRAWLYVSFVIVFAMPTAQTHGIVMCGDLRGASNRAEERELQAFINEAALHCLPTRLAAAYFANCDSRNAALWDGAGNPPAHVSRRVRDNFFFVGDDYSKILRQVPARCVPTQLGGARHLEIPGHVDLLRYDFPVGVA